jgi:hypothetical protein
MIARRSVVGLKLTRKRFFRRTGLSPREHRPRDYGNTEPLVKIRHWALKQRAFIHLSDFQAALRAQSLFPCKSDEPSISQGRTKNENGIRVSETRSRVGAKSANTRRLVLGPPNPRTP